MSYLHRLRQVSLKATVDRALGIFTPRECGQCDRRQDPSLSLQAMAHLGATAGTAAERDGRTVIDGLTDAEGVIVCEQVKSVLAQ